MKYKRKETKQITNKKEKGITLIALVITIVLLILAGVSIATLTGNNGILTKTQEAKEQTIIGQEKEQVELAYNSVSANKLGGNVTSGDLQEELNRVLGNGKTEVTGENTLKIKFTDTNNIYTVSSNSGVEEYQKAEVTPVYAFLCDTNNDGTGETLILSSTQTIDGYTIVKNYGDNEAYQTDEENAENSYGNLYYHPIWKNETTFITNVILYNNIVPSTTERWFANCSNLTEIANMSYLNTSNVTTMTNMFENCSNLINLDVKNFDTSSVTNMVSMFSGCSKLTSLNVRNFDTSNVTNMNAMFRNCSGLSNLDLSSFNTKNTTSLTTTFYGCTKLKTILVSSQWSTDKVDTYSGNLTFSNCTSLVGGKGTKYDSNHTDVTYAHIDEGTENPGYLTASEK